MNPTHHDTLDAAPPKKKSGNHSCLIIVIVGGLGSIVVLGLIAAIAIPAFLKYTQKAKASEATLTIGELQHKALQYYEESGTDGACHFPPSANPVPAGQPCCEQVGPTDGEKWSPSPKTWAQKGWSDLGVSMPEPTYFAYQTVNTPGPDGTHSLELRAFADFKAGGPRHTYSITLEGKRNDQGECVANAQAPVLTNEFE